MEDEDIVRLYWDRNERAISETDRKYGPFCHRLAVNILTSREDAEECVSDTWHRAWDTMPPQLPRSLMAYLGRIVRNLALSRYRASHAQKRYAGQEALLSELSECLPAKETVEGAVEGRRIAQVVARWLEGLPRRDRVLFLRRYWYGDPLQDLAGRAGLSAPQLAQRMLRLRRSLKAELEREEVWL